MNHKWLIRNSKAMPCGGRQNVCVPHQFLQHVGPQQNGKQQVAYETQAPTGESVEAPTRHWKVTVTPTLAERLKPVMMGAS